MRWSIGIDPGYGELGMLVAPDGDDIVPTEWATYTCPKRGVPDLSRSVSVAGCVINRIVGWVDKYEIKELDIAVETPVFKRNPKTYTIQTDLIQEIKSGLFHVVAGLTDECWLTLVNPQTSKMLAGCGPREKPVAQSPWGGGRFRVKGPEGATLPGMTMATREALADAWAHSLATWGAGGVRMPLHLMKAAVIKQVHEGPEESGESYWAGICQHIEDS